MSLENYKAIMLLHALGDTIGFKNGEWEFNFFTNELSYKTTLEIVFQFISLGGVSSIDLKDWNVSDDTLIHITTAKTLLQSKSDKNDYILNFKKNLIKTLQEIKYDENVNGDVNKIKKNKFRGLGATTVYSVESWKNNKNIPYKTSGGNGVAMRTLCVGAYYNKEKDTIRYITLTTPIEWENYSFKWTCDWVAWKNSSMLKVIIEGKEIALLEIQFHTKNRTNMAIRWCYENFLTIWKDNLTIYDL